jgi:hypothetical protein
MAIKKFVSIALIAGIGAWGSTSAWAQDSYVMIVPGVYTTPEISAKCQAYAAQRVTNASDDVSRTRVALACVKKLWKEQNAKGGKKKAAG